MVEAISLSPHYITATALATKTMHTLTSRGGFKKERGDFWPHTSCLLQYSTKLSQSKKEAFKKANRTRLTNTASCCLDVAGRLASFFLSIQFSIFNHCSILISLEALLAVYYCGSQASLESMEDLCFVTFVQKNDGLSDGEHGQPSGIRGAFL